MMYLGPMAVQDTYCIQHGPRADSRMAINGVQDSGQSQQRVMGLRIPPRSAVARLGPNRVGGEWWPSEPSLFDDVL
jgi:hypothetical protein